MASSYQARSVRVELKKTARYKWQFRLVDWFNVEIERHDRFPTKLAARVAGARAKLAYQQSLPEPEPIKLDLVKPQPIWRMRFIVSKKGNQNG